MKRIYLPLFVGLLLAACSKHNTDNKPSTPPDQQSATDVHDQFDALNLLNSFTNGASIIQAAIASAKPTGTAIAQGTTITSGTTVTTGYDFNGLELGKPEDLFCGATITGGENADNYTVNIGYNGPDCSGQLFLKGSIVISIPKYIGWDAIHKGLGYFLIDLNKLQCTRILDNTHFYFTGVLDVVNREGSIAEVVAKKAPIYASEQSIQLNDPRDSITLHYDDGTLAKFATLWIRRYSWDNQIVIENAGYYSTFYYPFWAAAGITRHGRPFHWTAPKSLFQYQNCSYKTNGLMYCLFDDNYPGHDSVSVVFGTNATGTQAPAAVWQGTQCLDRSFLHFTTWHQDQKTLDLVLPE